MSTLRNQDADPAAVVAAESREKVVEAAVVAAHRLLDVANQVVAGGSVTPQRLDSAARQAQRAAEVLTRIAELHPFGLPGRPK
jgi:hypothetical protein